MRNKQKLVDKKKEVLSAQKTDINNDIKKKALQSG